MTSEEVKVVQADEAGSPGDAYFRVGAVDRAMATLDETSAVGFDASVELIGAFDISALAEAWRRLASLHPILTCVRRGDTWKPSTSPAIGPGVGQPWHEEPPVALRVTEIEDGVRLTILCNHVAFDGMASVILLGDLRDEYEGVLDGRGERDADWTPRTLESVVAAPPEWREVGAAVLRGASTWWQTSPSTHLDPAPLATEPSTGHALMELAPALDALAPPRRKHNWSTDAVLVGVLEKAWVSVFGAPSGESSWLVAQDLRPALGMTRGIGNLSVTGGVSIADPASDLLSVIDDVNARLEAQTRDLTTAAAALPGWGFASGAVFTRMLRRSVRQRHYRSLSNVGQLGDSMDRWGQAWLRRVWFVGPLAHPPFTSFIAAGHGPSTLVSVRTSPRWLTDDHAAALERAALDTV